MKRFGHLPMPNLAYQDPIFMESLPARPLRILAEYIDPINRLRRANVGTRSSCLVRRASSRAISALVALKKVQHAARGRRTHEWRTKINAAKSIVEMSRYYEEARELRAGSPPGR